MTMRPNDAPQFYLTAPAPCPYLPGKSERKVFARLVGERAREINDALTQGGFRRSQNIAYRPACENCQACVSVRVAVEAFQYTSSFRRIRKRNADLEAKSLTPSPTPEQYALFRQYLDARHADGGMVDMTALDYAMMIEDTQVQTIMVEYRSRSEINEPNGELLAVALTDVLSNGLSIVYSFFEPNESRRSLGSWIILEHVERAKKMGLPYVYLGYWIEESKKMAYKTRFQPQEHLTHKGWQSGGFTP